MDLDEYFDRATAAVGELARVLEGTVSARIEPLARISAMGDRIDRLNRENAEILEKLVSGKSI